MNFERKIFTLASALIFVLVIFGWGFSSAKFQIFPYDILQDTKKSLVALRQLYALEVGTHRSAHEISSPSTLGGVTVNKVEDDDGVHFLLTLFHEGEFKAHLIDRQGNLVHEWRIPYEQQGLSEAKDTGIPLSTKNLTIHGACIRENGDLYVVVEYRGLVKLDKYSELIWVAKNFPAHHAVSCNSDDSVWTLGRTMITDEEEWMPLVDHSYYDEQALHLSADGKILAEISLLDVIFKNQYEGILYGGHPGKPSIIHDDPLHTNDIDILSDEQATHFPSAKAGDLMVSFRTISTVLIFDPQSLRIKWSMTGPFLRQHDPEVASDGSLLIYDNRTTRGQRGIGAKHLKDPQAFGYSRIIAVSPSTRQIIWQFQGSKEVPFYSSIQGKLKEMRSGNVVVVEPEGGRVFEVDKASGEIVWEFVNLVEAGFVGRVTGVIPLTDNQLEFLHSD